MRVEIELTHDDKQDIAALVVESLKPLLSLNGSKDNDIIFDVPGLAEYLNVPESWVRDRVSNKIIPFFRAGKYIRFKKPEIDRWIKKHSFKPL